MTQILLTGATGYVGGRLFPLLKKKNLSIRCLVRHPDKIAGHRFRGATIQQGDVISGEGLAEALQGIHTAYYLVHALASDRDFEKKEQLGAEKFAAAAKAAGVEKIIYLSGLGHESSDLSPHLKSRHQVGKILAASGVPTLEFRAGIILGSGSLSFEMVRALVERLPLMIIPRWVQTPTQPIAIEDVLSYLILALDHPLPHSQIFEIGGSDVVSYQDIMKEYGRQRGLHRLMIPVPVLTPHLSSRWLGLITPLFAKVGKKLIEGIRNPTLVRNSEALRVFPVRPMGIQKAIARALSNEDEDFALTHWADALSSSKQRQHWGGVRFKNRLIDSRSIKIPVPAKRAFRPIQEIGGKRGWYYGNWLWQIRGFLDSLIGGVGLRRGRRDPVDLKVGDALDFWRVERLDPPHTLLLRAEMKLPGRAWLEFEIDPTASGVSLTQTAMFDPIGLAGLMYWYLLYPIHGRIFRGMLRGIARKAEQEKA